MTPIFRKRGRVSTSFTGKREFIAKVRECQALARQRFPDFNLMDEDLPIVFVARGNAAGMAKWRKSRDGMQFNIEFSIDAIQKDWDDMVNDTIQHEMAHIVDYAIHGRSNHHNHVWKRIAHRLGCTGKTTHNIAVQKARRSKKYVYVASCGREFEASSVRHKRIQSGRVYTFTDTGGKITADGYTGKMIMD